MRSPAGSSAKAKRTPWGSRGSPSRTSSSWRSRQRELVTTDTSACSASSRAAAQMCRPIPPPSTNGHTSRDASTIDHGRPPLLAWPLLMRLALVAREFYPFLGGGIAPIVAAAARYLAPVAEVTVVTSAGYRDDYERLRREGDPRLPPPSVRFVFVEEPHRVEWGAFMSYMHAYSARVDRALREAFPDRGPDLLEFCDYLGEGFVTTQARRAHDPWLEHTRLCVRLHTTAYFCSVLDGHLPDDFATKMVFEAERYVLRHADTVLWSGGDVLDTYRRVYGADALAPAVKLPDAFLDEQGGADAVTDGPGETGALRLLYLGRLERRKGVQNLVRAITGLEGPNVHLTLLGGDTGTAPLGGSVKTQLELMAAGDPRIEFVDTVPRSAVGDFIRNAHAVVIPSLWECWPNTAREALMHNRPVLATPVGGLTEIVKPGRSGWLTRDRSPEAIRDAVAELAARPAEVQGLIQSGAPRAVFDELADPATLVEGYRRLAAEAPARPAQPQRAAARLDRDPLLPPRALRARDASPRPRRRPIPRPRS